MHRRNKKRRSGFTLVELLTVVFIISVLMDVALPIYISALDDSRTKTCRSNMQTISNAVEAARIKNGFGTDYSPYYSLNVKTDIAKFPDLTSAPACPIGGIYSIAAGTKTGDFKVSCSVAVHASYEAGVDSH